MEKTINELTKAINELTKVIEGLTAQSDILDYVAIVFSGIAIIISVYAVFVEKKINNVNLQSVYYTQIFSDYLKTKIPKAGAKLSFGSNGKLESTYRQLTKVMFSMVRDSGYFRYVNNDFYLQLRELVKDLDEYLVNLAGEIIIDRGEQKEKLVEIHQKIQEIVKTINKEYQKY